MKRAVIIMILLVFVAACALGVTLNQTTPAWDQHGWRPLRTVTASDTALTASTSTWTDIGDSSAFVPIPAGWTWMAISAYAYGDGDGAGDPSSGTFNYRLFGARQGASANLMASGAMAVGSLQLSHTPTGSYQSLNGASSYRWVEGPPTVTSYWMTTVAASGTTDDQGFLTFSTNGLYGIMVEVTSLANCTSVVLIYTGG